MLVSLHHLLRRIFLIPRQRPGNQNGDTAACMNCFRVIGHVTRGGIYLPLQCPFCSRALKTVDDVIVPEGLNVVFHG